MRGFLVRGAARGRPRDHIPDTPLADDSPSFVASRRSVPPGGAVMHRRVALGVALVSVLGLVVAAPAAGAAAKRSHVIDSTIAAAVVGGSPTGKAVVAGTVSDPRFGDGATVYRTQPPANGVQQSSFTAFFSNGTFKG